MTYYAILDLRMDAFVMRGDGQWLFESRDAADAHRLYETSRLSNQALSLTKFEEAPKTAKDAMQQVHARIDRSTAIQNNSEVDA